VLSVHALSPLCPESRSSGRPPAVCRTSVARSHAAGPDLGGEGYVITGLRPRRYTVTALIDDAPLLISPALSPRRKDSGWSNRFAGGFENRGAGIDQLRVEVQGR